jgi:hypothetical protein
LALLRTSRYSRLWGGAVSKFIKWLKLHSSAGIYHFISNP